MLAFAHIPTGAHNHPDDFKIDGREREALSGLRPPIVFPAFGQLTAGAVPLAKRLVRYFSRAKNLPVPPQAALLAGPPPRRRSGLQGRDEERAFGPNKERSFKSTPAPIFDWPINRRISDAHRNTKDQRPRGRICRAARHLRRNAAEPRRREIQPVNKGVNEPHRVVRTDIVIHCLRQKQQLRAVVTSDVRHAEFYRVRYHAGIRSVPLLTQSA